MTAPDDIIRPREEIYRARPERPFRALIDSLVEDLQRLVRLEIALFKREMAGAARRLGVGIAAVVIGAIMALTGWLALFAAAIIALAIVWPPWAATLVLGALALVVAGLLLYLGIRQMRVQSLTPQHTLNTLREDGVWIKERIL
ncbi:MAG: phage holin family protein [Alphaproteobacteria bacterium]|nr:phage holin family protein [Alphaproteobacteria bacterium]